MRRLIIEHLRAAELPKHWAKHLDLSAEQRVTVSIDIEKDDQLNAETTSEDNASDASEIEAYRKKHPAFGMWADRTDMGDTIDYVNKLRAPRFPRD